MLIFLLTFALFIKSPRASWSPQSTYTNQTQKAWSGASVTGCPTNCYRERMVIRHMSWFQMPSVTTVTVETHVLIVHEWTNSTGTSIIYNTDVDRRSYHNPEINQAGTAVATVFGNLGDSTSYRTVAYPTTAYGDYESSYSLCGTLPTVMGGSATCLTYQDCAFTENGFNYLLTGRAPSFAFPSHPPLPEGIQPGLNTIQDPRGLTYQAMMSDECDDSDIMQQLFPHLGIWFCRALNDCVPPSTNLSPRAEMVFGFKKAAEYLTATSTSVEAGELVPSSTLVVPRPLDSPTVSDAMQTKSSAPIPNSPTSALPDLDTIPPLVPIHSKGRVTGSIHSQFDSTSATTSALDKASAETEVLPPTSTTFIPIAETTTDARGGFATMTNLAAAVPVLVASINPHGNKVGSTSLSMISAVASQAPATLVPLIVSSTHARGTLAVSESSAAAIAIPTFFMNAQGQTVVTTSLSTAPGGTFIPNIILSTNSQAPIVSRTSYLPAFVSTTTDAQGSHIITTSPVLTATVHDAPGFPITTAPSASMVGAQIVNANSLNQYTTRSQSLSPGGIVTVSGTEISLSPDRNETVVETLMQDAISRLILAITTSPPFLATDARTTMANAQGPYIVGPQTLRADGNVTLSGTRVSLASNGANAVLGTSTEDLAITSSPALTIGSTTVNSNAGNQYTIGPQIPTPGGIITISDTGISLVSDGANASVGTSTERLGGSSGSATSTGSCTSTGGAQSKQRVLWVEAMLVFTGLGIVMRL